MAGGDRYGHLDGLRGLAALNVMLSHAVVAFDFAVYNGVPAMSHWGSDLTLSAFPFLLPVAGASFSVCVFFVLSGFVLARAFSRSVLGVPAQVAKRIVRLTLPIASATLLSWALLRAGLIINHEAAALTRSGWLAAQMTQAPDFLAALHEGTVGSWIAANEFTTSYNTSLWTMPIEFLGSAILIVCFAIGRWGRQRGITRTAGGVAMLILAILLNGRFIALFAAGAAIHLLDVGPLLRARRLSSGCFVVMLVVALFLGPSRSVRPAVPHGIGS